MLAEHFIKQSPSVIAIQVHFCQYYKCQKERRVPRLRLVCPLDNCYIGRTNRSLGTRLKEHRRMKPSGYEASITSKQKHYIQPSTSAFAHKGWKDIGQSFHRHALSDDIEEWVDQPSISSIPNSPSVSQVITDHNDAIEEDCMKICSQSPARPLDDESITDYESHQSNLSYLEHLEEVEVNEGSVELGKDTARISDVASNSSNRLSIPVDFNVDSNISEQSINLPSSPNALSEEICFLSPTGHHEVGQSLEQIHQNTGSISSDSASPNVQNLLKGTKWLQTVVHRTTERVKNEECENDNEVHPRDAFKKINVLKDGLAEKLGKVLFDQQTLATLQKKTAATKSCRSLQIRVLTMRPYCNTFVMADCEKIDSESTELSTIADSDVPIGETLGLLLHSRTVHRLTICNGCILHIIPPWQILHVPALDKSFILCPSVKSVNLVPDTARPVKCSTIITWTCGCRQGGIPYGTEAGMQAAGSLIIMAEKELPLAKSLSVWKHSNIRSDL